MGIHTLDVSNNKLIMYEREIEIVMAHANIPKKIAKRAVKVVTDTLRGIGMKETLKEETRLADCLKM